MTNQFKVENYNDLCKVLVIDHFDLSRKKIIKSLEDQKINVIGDAKNINDAIKIINKTGANIIVSDILLPDLSGIDFIKKFSSKTNFKYFIFISSFTSQEIIADAVNAGAFDFISKPFEEESLQQSVLRACTDIAKNSI